MHIRQAAPEDYAIIHELVREAFLRAEHRDGNEQELVLALRGSESYVSQLELVSERDEKLIGHILFTKAAVGRHTVLALAPLSVLPGCQKQGVGSALIREGHRIAASLRFGYSVVLGSAAYYPKFGYVPAVRFGIFPPFDVPSENFMAFPLTEPAEKVAGVVRYAKEFGI